MKRFFWKFLDPGAGGGGGNPTETPEQALLKKIKSDVDGILKDRGYKNGDEVSGLISKALEGVNLEGLRTFDATKMEESIRKVGEQVEAMKANAAAGAGAKAKRTAALKEVLEKNWDKIEGVMRSKEAGNEVVLSMRALQPVMTTGNVIDENTPSDDLIESFSVDAFVKKRRPNDYIFDIANRRTVAQITEYKTWLEEGSEDGAFAIVNEGAIKPLVSKTLVRNESKAKKVAGKRVYTEEFEKFRKEAMIILEDLFNDQLIRNYNALLTTSLLASAASYVGTSLDDQYAVPTDYHAVGAVAAQIEALDFAPDVLIINPQDKWRIALQQGTDGHFFVQIPMYNASGEVTMMGFKVVTTNRIAVGEAILGESNLFKVEDEPVKVKLGYGITVTKNGSNVVTEVESDFDTNRFRIIAETFFHAYIASNHTGSFVKFNFATVKAALLKP